MPQISVKTKLDELCDQLTVMAQRSGAGAKLPTSRALSHSFGVSRTTLHIALERLESQSIISCKQGSGIFVADDLRALTLPRSIALVCDSTFFRGASHSPFWDLLVEESERRAGLKNEAFSLHFSTSSGKSGAGLQAGLLREIGEGRVQGVLGVGTSQAVMEQLGEGVPFVTFAAPARWRVNLDYRPLIGMGVTELGRQGCRRLGLWLPGFLAGFSDPIIEVFQAALTARQLEFHPVLVQIGPNDENERQTLQGQGYEIARTAFEQPQGTRPDGLIVANDMMTHAALVTMQKLGVRAGQDVKIATHANRGSTVLASHENELTLLEFDPAAVVEAMFEMLESLMDGQTPPTSSVGIAPQLKL